MSTESTAIFSSGTHAGRSITLVAITIIPR